MNTDPIADLLVRLKNASNARIKELCVPSSRIKAEILKVMKDKKRILDYKEETKDNKKTLVIKLIPDRPLFTKRISSPGQRIYKKAREIEPVMAGYGFAIYSTSQGIMTHAKARDLNLGGELICEME